MEDNSNWNGRYDNNWIALSPARSVKWKSLLPMMLFASWGEGGPCAKAQKDLGPDEGQQLVRIPGCPSSGLSATFSPLQKCNGEKGKNGLFSLLRSLEQGRQ